MMMSEPRHPRWSRDRERQLHPRHPGVERGEHRRFLSSGTGSSAVPGPVSTSVALKTSVVTSSSGGVERSTDTLTRLSKPAATGVPVNTNPRLPEMPDSVVPPGGVVGLLRRRFDEQILDAHEAADVGRVDDEAALQLADRKPGVRSDQHDVPVRSTECSVASMEALPTTGVVDPPPAGSRPPGSGGRVAG